MTEGYGRRRDPSTRGHQVVGPGGLTPARAAVRAALPCKLSRMADPPPPNWSVPAPRPPRYTQANGAYRAGVGWHGMASHRFRQVITRFVGANRVQPGMGRKRRSLTRKREGSTKVYQAFIAVPPAHPGAKPVVGGHAVAGTARALDSAASRWRNEACLRQATVAAQQRISK